MRTAKARRRGSTKSTPGTKKGAPTCAGAPFVIPDGKADQLVFGLPSV